MAGGERNTAGRGGGQSRTLGAMSEPSVPAREVSRFLALARSDRSAARKALAELDLDRQVALISASPLARRAELLELASDLEQLVPLLPPAELCFVVKAIGLADAGWLLEHASEEQIATAVDLDAWSGRLPDRGRLGVWLAALGAAGEETLLRAARGLDFELLVYELRARISVVLTGRDEFVDLPSGALSLDGQFHLIPRESGDDLEDVLALLQTLFQHDYWFYHRLLQAVDMELDDDLEEWALRWRSGRLQDLGFPPLDDAKRIYAYLKPGQLAELPAEPHALEVGEWPLPVFMPVLPVGRDAELLLFRALAALPEAERRPLLFAFLALVNRVAVADALPLGDAETLPQATEKAARLASRGLAHVATERGVTPAEALRRGTLERLFRVGANLERETGSNGARESSARAGPDGSSD
jgi:hypothetical protein